LSGIKEVPEFQKKQVNKASPRVWPTRRKKPDRDAAEAHLHRSKEERVHPSEKDGCCTLDTKGSET